ncbi:MAG: DUF222 domain-containing protein [Woeseia sp.]
MLAHASAAPPAVAGDIESSIDDLDRAIVNLAARLNAVTHDFLILVRRFDERAGWLGWGFESCADWLHWRCDLSLSAAREKVRVAHALKTLPATAMAFAPQSTPPRRDREWPSPPRRCIRRGGPPRKYSIYHVAFASR